MQRLLGIDYGHRRIGLALSDPLGITAQPLEVLERVSLKEDFARIAAIVAKYGVEKIVLGLPINMNGTESGLTSDVRRFAEELRESVALPVEFIDERLTTMQAERMLVEEADMSREKRKKVRDKLAASLILQSYMDQNP
ncbi:MAG: Holliday junction DNA helicase RuvA [Elusimicrobia bacterium RIFOXYA2_FULL_50_26]|nr:MAG: Holliday junction DNA helicase RuvA [Elusimicrobia bacterium RIFOXYA2_FULL_50_26]OGS25364.1 MAG: Holliday junction DNA helicase RuvA [Elusimicrobia bacterium RIFOXYB2_FULL_50_12]